MSKQVIILFLTIILVSCKKKNDIHRFIGDYDTVKTLVRHGRCQSGFEITRTETDTSIILKVSAGDDPKSLEVLGYNNITLNEDGEYRDGRFFVKFEENHLYSEYHGPGIGCSNTTYYDGQKID